MKTSNKTLLITFMVILALTTIIIVGMEIFFSHNTFPMQKTSENSKTLDKEFILSGFDSINCGGSWELEIVYADFYQVIISAPEFMMDYVKPGVVGKTLQINQWFFSEPHGISLKAKIFMPSLTGIESSGFSNSHFSRFNIAHMNLKASETSRIVGSNSKIANLDCMGSGSAQINLSSCPTVNAELNLAATSQITLNMAGGKLNGHAADNSVLTFSGEVTEVAIDTSGTVKIRQKNLQE
ncbi:MAG TPA: DUF2807 domain-containing protein [Bacillota bacterium]|nr:DUF2807 domain-containing protein [Bacillota bacterium]